jgi:hypothetical protein
VADSGLAPHLSTRRNRVLEQPVESGVDRPALAGHCPGTPNLIEDLALPDDGGLEP